MSVDPEQRDAMARMIAIMNGQTPPAPPPAASRPDGGPARSPAPIGLPAPGAVSAEEVNHMKAILELFSGAADGALREALPAEPAPGVSSHVMVDRMLAEAMETEATEDGARIGRWEIRAHGEGRQKSYDVVSVADGVAVAADLSLYEAALGLVRVLNSGGVLNSPKAMEILKAQGDYAAALEDAILFTKRLRESANHPRRAVLEDRCGDAKRRAISARDRVMKQVGKLD